MSDEEITIKVTTNVDASEVESLEKSIEQLSDSTIDVTTESDDSQLVETEEKIDEIDGSVIENNVEVDNSQLEETQEKIDEQNNSQIQVQVKVDDSEINNRYYTSFFINKKEFSKIKFNKSIAYIGSLKNQIENNEENQYKDFMDFLDKQLNNASSKYPRGKVFWDKD